MFATAREKRFIFKGSTVKFLKGKNENQRKMRIHFCVLREKKNYHRLTDTAKYTLSMKVKYRNFQINKNWENSQAVD